MDKNHYLATYNTALNDLSFWHPIIAKFQLLSPETYIIKHNVNLLPLANKERPEILGLDTLIEKIKFCANKVGYPCFIRTGQTSNKHDWKNTCFLEKEEDIEDHLGALAEFSELASMLYTIPTDTIVIRKLIKTKPIFVSFNGMPVTKEIRVFIEKAEDTQSGQDEISVTPYWPIEAFDKHVCTKDGVSISLEEVQKELVKIYELTEEDKKFFASVSTFLQKRLKGSWSVDFLQDENGQWFLIDMAVAEWSARNSLTLDVFSAIPEDTAQETPASFLDFLDDIEIRKSRGEQVYKEEIQ